MHIQAIFDAGVWRAKAIGVQVPVLFTLFAFGTVGCAEWDNPTSLADLNPEVEFEIEAQEIETLEEIEVHVRAFENGVAMDLTRAQLKMELSDGGAARTVEFAPEGDGYAAHVTFYEPGDYHLRFFGTPSPHFIGRQMGEHELEVRRHHQVIGPYWVELETSSAPVFENNTAHLELFVFDLLPDGSPGGPVGGLDIELEVHDTNGVETPVSVGEEEPGEYEAEYAFGEAGEYELHVEIDVGGVTVDGEFHLPVEAPASDQPNEGEGGGGHGHS